MLVVKLFLTEFNIELGIQYLSFILFNTFKFVLVFTDLFV